MGSKRNNYTQGSDMKNDRNVQDNETFHDFLSENPWILFLGGFRWRRRPLFRLCLCLFRQTAVTILWLAMGYLAFRTMVITSFDKPITVELIQLVCFIFGASAIQVVKYITRGHLRNAQRMLKQGIIKYEGILEEQREIMKEKVKEIRLFIFVFMILTVCCLSMNNIFMPALRFIFTEDNLPFRSINRYLPLPISMPFDTRTWLGYSSAYASHAICYFFILITFVCNVQTATSTSLQLCAEFEVLNHSLENMEKRAHYKYVKFCGGVSQGDKLNTFLYDKPEFQKCLYACLRENVQHHQSILKLTKSISPYIEISLFTVLLYVSVVIAAAIVLIIEDFRNNVALVMFLLSDALGFLQICWVGQLITNKSAETRTSLYSTPWYMCTKEYNKVFKVLLLYVQKPIALKDSGFNIHLSLETYGDMMSLGYKMVNLFR